MLKKIVKPLFTAIAVVAIFAAASLFGGAVLYYTEFSLLEGRSFLFCCIAFFLFLSITFVPHLIGKKDQCPCCKLVGPVLEFVARPFKRQEEE